MNNKFFNSIRANLLGENRLLKFVLLVFAIVSIVNSVQIHRALTMQRTILLPAEAREPMELNGDSASPSYLKSMALYITSLAFNYQSSNARGRFDELLTMYAPDDYPEAFKIFKEIADKVEASAKASSVFHQQKYVTYDLGKKIEVTGQRRIFSEYTVILDAQKTYVIEYGIEDGHFMVHKIYEKTATGGEGKNG
jgi:conjugal transfer pilus assembly protein TraE